MVGIPLFDEECECSDTDELFVVQEKILEKHDGAPQHLRLWRDKVEPTNILRDLRTTIRDAFFLADPLQSKGVPTASGEARVTVYYDFSPPAGNCPILNVH